MASVDELWPVTTLPEARRVVTRFLLGGGTFPQSWNHNNLDLARDVLHRVYGAEPVLEPLNAQCSSLAALLQSLTGYGRPPHAPLVGGLMRANALLQYCQRNAHLLNVNEVRTTTATTGATASYVDPAPVTERTRLFRPITDLSEYIQLQATYTRVYRALELVGAAVGEIRQQHLATQRALS